MMVTKSVSFSVGIKYLKTWKVSCFCSGCKSVFLHITSDQVGLKLQRNFPTTTEIYTLSLHDALPIYDFCSIRAEVIFGNYLF